MITALNSLVLFTSPRPCVVWSWGDSRMGYQPSWSRIPLWGQCHTGSELVAISTSVLQLHTSYSKHNTIWGWVQSLDWTTGLDYWTHPNCKVHLVQCRTYSLSYFANTAPYSIFPGVARGQRSHAYSTNELQL